MSKTEESVRGFIETLGDQTGNNTKERETGQSIFDLENIDHLLEVADSSASAALFSAKEINEILKKREEALKKMSQNSSLRASAREKAGKYNPVTPTELFTEGRITEAEKDRLEKMKSIAGKAKQSGVKDSNVDSIVDAYSKFMKKVRKDNDEIRSEMISNSEVTYAQLFKENESLVVEAEKNPRVLEELEKQARKEYESFVKETEAEASMFLKNIEKVLASTGDRNRHCIKNLSQLIGMENLSARLANGGEDEQKAVLIAKKELKQAILSSEKRLKPQDLIPWVGGSSNHSYVDSLNYLRQKSTIEKIKKAISGDEKKSEEFISKIEKVLEENSSLRKIYGSKYIFDKKTKENKLSPLWETFALREKNDRTGITPGLIEQQKKEQERIDSILGCGGFAVEVPIYKDFHGQKTMVDCGRGYVLIEKRKNFKGNDFLVVADTAGFTDGLRKGDNSPMDLRSFKSWIQPQAKKFLAENN